MVDVSVMKKWADDTTLNERAGMKGPVSTTDPVGTKGPVGTTLRVAGVDEFFFVSSFIASFLITGYQSCY
jgi:hypothetical protein